ncbi:Rad17 cell cycle checkpoint protein-domain-containing protein [Paraphysoderma sedebokerense]|nr:Rad17 cell cycle checkpoint protein-domain-containing protein [Paraphysoderma sedebokerense]
MSEPWHPPSFSLRSTRNRTPSLPSIQPQTDTVQLPQEQPLWIDKHAPATEEELCVHKKKVEEVKSWLKRALDDVNRPNKIKYNRILVLTGPTGSGKTAVVNVLSKSVDFAIVEWINPVNNNVFSLEPHNNDNFRESYVKKDYISIMQTFSEFLSRADKYPTLQLSSSSSKPLFTDHPSSLSTESSTPNRKILLIEDFPHISNLNSRAQFHDAIRQYAFSSRTKYPLVLIVSEASMLSSFDESLLGGYNGSRDRMRDEMLSVKTLLPHDVLESPVCKTITFNSIAKTFLQKALDRIINIEFPIPVNQTSSRRRKNAKLSPVKFTQSDITKPPNLDPSRRPKSQDINLIVAHANGDIRNAINMLQFASLMKSVFKDEPPAKTKRVKRTEEEKEKEKERELEENRKMIEMAPYLCGRESPTSIFSAIGKVLYNKRSTLDASDIFVKADSVDNQQSKILGKLRHFEMDEINPKLPPHLTCHEREPINISAETILESLPFAPSLYVLFLHANYPTFFTSISQLTYLTDILSTSDVLSKPNLSYEYSGRAVGEMYAGIVATRGLYFAHGISELEGSSSVEADLFDDFDMDSFSDDNTFDVGVQSGVSVNSYISQTPSTQSFMSQSNPLNTYQSNPSTSASLLGFTNSFDQGNVNRIPSVTSKPPPNQRSSRSTKLVKPSYLSCLRSKRETETNINRLFKSLQYLSSPSNLSSSLSLSNPSSSSFLSNRQTQLQNEKIKLMYSLNHHSKSDLNIEVLPYLGKIMKTERLGLNSPSPLKLNSTVSFSFLIINVTKTDQQQLLKSITTYSTRTQLLHQNDPTQELLDEKSSNQEAASLWQEQEPDNQGLFDLQYHHSGENESKESRNERIGEEGGREFCEVFTRDGNDEGGDGTEGNEEDEELRDWVDEDIEEW